MTAPEDFFSRGHLTGVIETRLDQHDRHFSTIQIALTDITSELKVVTLLLQRLSDQAISRDATILATASALEKAEAARRMSNEQNWAPMIKIYATLAAVATVVGLWLAVHKG